MAEFLPAYNATMKIEYGYNPGNGEAETINGIDISQHPNLPLWSIVHAIKKANPAATVSQLNKLFDANTALQTAIQAFYKAEIWDSLKLGTITDQQAANAIYDGTVNPCIITSSKAVQIACNSVKPGLLVIDGQLGPKSISGINSIDPKLFVTAFIAARVANYYERVRLTPTMAQWLPSWLGRCKPYKS